MTRTWLVLLTAAASLSAQSQQKPPVFRASVDRVAVDFIAVGQDGRPVPDLDVSDLSLKVDGKPREIRSLQFVRLVPATEPPASALTPAEAVPAPFGSNAPSDAGRAIILVFHHTSMLPGDERPAKAAAAAFIKSLTARDRVGLVTFQEGGVVVDLTSNHTRVLDALAKVTGRKPIKHTNLITVSTDAAAANEDATAVRNLVALMNSLASIDGPKTVVFVSGGLPGLGVGDVKAADRANEYRDLGRAAGKVHARVFIMHAHSLGGMDIASRDATFADDLPTAGFKSGVGDGLEEFAGATGGAIFRQAASAAGGFARMNLESSAYYLLSFDAETKERDGKHHKITVTASRSNLLVRARPEFLIEKPDTAKPAPPATQVRSLLKNLLAYRDLPLRAVAYAFRGPSGQNTVIVAADSDSTAKLNAVSYAFIDEKGQIVAQWDADAIDLATAPVVSATTIAPGTYKLRVAASGADGKLGAVDYEFEATLTDAGPLKTGGLMLGRMEDAKFIPQISFEGEDTATAYVEVYGVVPSDQKATVTVEIARTADGPAIATVPAEVANTRDADRWIATGRIPLTQIKPGDYVVRAILRMGTESGTIVRTLRKR